MLPESSQYTGRLFSSQRKSDGLATISFVTHTNVSSVLPNLVVTCCARSAGQEIAASSGDSGGCLLQPVSKTSDVENRTIFPRRTNLNSRLRKRRNKGSGDVQRFCDMLISRIGQTRLYQIYAARQSIDRWKYRNSIAAKSQTNFSNDPALGPRLLMH